MSIYIGDKEIKNVYIGDGWDDYSAMRGPAPDGFHVPLMSEWTGLKTIMDGLSLTTASDWRINLHIPFAGFRNKYSSSAAVSSQGSQGNYWSSSPSVSSSPSFARILYLRSPDVSINSSSFRSHGYSVRCFKNSFELPTSSWTVINGTLGGAGIFRNQVDGLISITLDGTTGYTIQDKNLGATTVYSDGATLSEANCGKYYQWGNNYGFYWTGSVTTSSTQVNAQNYGPGNYYSSSTFITGNDDWSSVHNDNLWGGETGVQKKSNVKEIYVGTTKVRPSIINFATQGPAPDGFHVPLQTEWQGLKTIMDGLGLTLGSDWRTNLHIPFAGSRSRISAEAGYQGTVGSYWSSSPYASNNYYAHSLNLGGSSIDTSSPVYRSTCYSVRCFKNSFKIPTSSWTVINGTLGSAGIFWNQTDGLISITSDGTTGYTIQDKNLGATTVYNNGDTLTANNCGYFYQWGNNYGFPWTGSVATSSTTVNASTYGPGNYYSSGTFITRSSSPYDWSNPSNDNLRGGVDGNVPIS